MKKQISNKANKAISKNTDKSRDRNIYSYKQLPETRDISQFSFLQKKLNEQIKIREESYFELLEMIKHLDETKKSKIPVNFQKLACKKLFSPVRLQTTTSVQSQQLAHFKTQLAVLTSKKQIEQAQHKQQFRLTDKQLKALQEEISQLKYQIQQSMETKKQLNNLEEQFSTFKSSYIQGLNELNTKLEDKEKDQKNIFSQLHNKISNQLSFSNSIGIQVGKIQTSMKVIEATLTEMQKMFQKLQQKIDSQFETVMAQVNRSSKSINETRSSLEEIVYGESSKSKILGKDNGTGQHEGMAKQRPSRRETDLKQKLDSMQRLIESLQRRMDLIYQQYLAKPIKGKN